MAVLFNKCFGDAMAANVEEKVKQVAALMKARNSSLALAESCTGGLLSSYITKLSGVSSFYQGAVVSYSAQVKQNHLGVPHERVFKLSVGTFDNRHRGSEWRNQRQACGHCVLWLSWPSICKYKNKIFYR